MAETCKEMIRIQRMLVYHVVYVLPLKFIFAAKLSLPHPLQNTCCIHCLLCETGPYQGLN